MANTFTTETFSFLKGMVDNQIDTLTALSKHYEHQLSIHPQHRVVELSQTELLEQFDLVNTQLSKSEKALAELHQFQEIPKPNFKS